MTINTNVKMGEIISFSSGEYSDYGYVGLVIFRKDCDLIEQRNNYKTFCKSENVSGDFNEFVTFLCAKEFCLPLESRDIHLGDYGVLLDEVLHRKVR